MIPTWFCLESFGDEPELCDSFLTQCEIQFELQPSSFPTEHPCVAFAIPLLTWKAQSWGTAEWIKIWIFFQRLLHRTDQNFLFYIIAARGVLALAVTEDLIDLYILASDCKWNQDALCYAFFTRGSLMKSRMRLPQETQLSLWRNWNNLRPESTSGYGSVAERGTVNYRPCQSMHVQVRTPSVSSNPLSPEPQDVPMHIGRTWVSLQERQRRLQNHLRFYCARERHIAICYPFKAKGSKDTRGHLLNPNLSVTPLRSRNTVYKSIGHLKTS